MEKRDVDKNSQEMLKGVTTNSDKEARNQQYNAYVEKITPKHSCIVNSLKAFVIGGIICVLGQILINVFINYNIDKELAVTYATISLVLLSIILTGLDWYSKLAKFGGAGTLVPITGFANSVAAPAIEYKKEGQVFGIGCKIFTIAGPVILYGIFTSAIIGFVYWGLMQMGVI